MSEKEELKLPPLVPPQPPSPFVARLRGEVSASRGGELHSSLGSSLGRRREAAAAARRVSFAELEATEAEADVQRPCSPPKIQLKIKGSATKAFSLEGVSARSTIAELKALCQAHCSLPAEQQRMFYKGKSLQDGQTLEGAGIPNKGVVFLVKGTVTKPSCEDAAAEAERQRELDQEMELRAWVASVQGLMCVECGVNPGRLQTNGLCSICWREEVVKETRELKRRCEEAKRREEENLRRAEEDKRQAEEQELRRQKDPSRCMWCNKKIGLTGFQCPCGYFYCAKHRYAEEHNCSFDHAGYGRELLAEQARAARSSSSRG